MRKPTKFLTFEATVSATKDASQECIIEGYANTSTKDRVSDVVLPKAFESSLKTYLDNPVLLENHDWGKPVGVTQTAEITDKGLFVRCRISDTCPDLKQKIREGVLRTFSIGYNEISSDFDERTKTKIVSDLELLEISIVSVPANPEAKFVEVSSNNPLPAPKDEPTPVSTPPMEDKPKSAEEIQKAASALQECLADKIPKLLDEGYERDQAIAIAYSYCSEQKSNCAYNPKLLKGLKEFISSVEEACGSEIDRKSLIAICNYYTTNEEKMTKKELIDLLKAKSAPVQTETKADPATDPAAAAPKPPAAAPAAPEAQDLGKVLEAMMSKLDQLAQAMAQLLQDESSEDAEESSEQEPAAPADAEKAQAPAAAPAMGPDKCPKCGGEMMKEAETDGVEKCKGCGQPAEAEKSLEEMEKELAELALTLAQLS